MKKIIFLIFLTACTTEKNINNNILDFNMDQDLTFDEFKVLLEEYNKKKGYPDIDS